ncbi:MAG: hypothetical protein ACREFE_10570 [Limisphaerales bacterium]
MKKPRGIRKPRGYEPRNFSLNFHLASLEHIPGKPVSGEADSFLFGCKNYAQLVQMSVKCADNKYEVNFGGLNKPLMKYFKMTKKRLAEWPTSIATDICERILWAIENRDGYFFRDLARLCENPKDDIGLRSWLLIKDQIMWQELKKGQEPDCYYSSSELKKEAVNRGVMTEQQTERYLRQVCDEIGVRILRRKK